MARKYTSNVRPSGYTILIVDDQEEILSSNKELLESAGHRVLTAASGEEALALLQPGQVQLVVLDYFMPRMSGEVVVRELRKIDEDVRILLQTGYSGEKTPLEMMHDLDIQGYHDKADSPFCLLQLVEAALNSEPLQLTGSGEAHTHTRAGACPRMR